MVEVEKNRSIEIEVEAAKVKPFVVVGIPAFNEERTIAKVVLESQRFADKVVVCNDGSSDMTAEIAERLGADVARHERNLGYGAAIQSLFRRARELDADGQHDPSEVSNVVKPIVEGKADVVVGSRFVDERSAYAMPWYRRAGVKFVTRLTNNGARHGVKDGQSGFRAYSRRSLDSLIMFEDGMGVSAEILINARKQGLRICEVSCSCSYDVGVETSSSNAVRHGVGLVMSIVRLVVEDKPLALLGLLGIVCLLVGAVFGVWMLQIYAIEHRIITNVVLASVAFVLIGFFCLSMAITLYAITRLARKVNNRASK